VGDDQTIYSNWTTKAETSWTKPTTSRCQKNFLSAAKLMKINQVQWQIYGGGTSLGVNPICQIYFFDSNWATSDGLS
jgi:hypothetical protein